MIITKKTETSIQKVQKNLLLHRMKCEKEYSPHINTISSVPFNYSASFDEMAEKEGRACRFGVPDRLRMTAEEYEDRKPTERKHEERWQWARDFISKGDLSLEKMREVMEQQLERVPKLFFIRADKSLSVINGRMKGNAQYARVQRAKIIGYSEKLTRKYKYLYMLTVTCSQKEYGNNRLKAWEEYPRKLKKVNRFIRETLGGHYVYCLESVVKQFPHAHYVFGTNTEIDFGNLKELNQKKGCHLAIWKSIQKCLPAPVFCLKPVTSKQAVFYCSKYISKAENADLRKMKIPTGKKERRNARKEWATVVFPIVCHVRQWNCAHGLDKVDDLPEKEMAVDFQKKDVSNARMATYEYISIGGVSIKTKRFDIFEFREWYESKFEFTQAEMARVNAGFAEMHKMLDNPQTPTAERAELDMLLINFTNRCCCEMRIGSGKDLVELVGDDDKTFPNADPELLKKVRGHSTRIGCVDCPIMRFILRLHGEVIDAMPNKKEVRMTLDAKKLAKREEIMRETLKRNELHVLAKTEEVLLSDDAFRLCFEDKNEMRKYIDEKRQDNWVYKSMSEKSKK